MTTYIQIHTLTSHSTHNLNRDDLGQPKSVTFLGNDHGRISSQCIKKSIREMLKNSDNLEGKTASRTRQLPKLVRKHLEDKEIPEKTVTEIVKEIVTLGKKDGSSGDKKEETQLFFMTNQEIEEVKNIALKLAQEAGEKKAPDRKKEIKKGVQSIFKERKFRDGVDIAMFGRLTTSNVFEDCDAAIQVAHAISTYPVKNQDDFFTAVDDLGNDGDRGSGHMDEKKFNTGIFYKYATVNWDQLLSNLDGDGLLTQKVVSEFIQSFVLSLPTGSQNSMAAHQHPFTILVTMGAGTNTNLTNAFTELPFSKSKSSPLHETSQALLEEYCEEKGFYGDFKKVDHAFLASRCKKATEKVMKEYKEEFQICPSLEDLLEKIGSTLGEVSA